MLEARGSNRQLLFTVVLFVGVIALLLGFRSTDKVAPSSADRVACDAAAVAAQLGGNSNVLEFVPPVSPTGLASNTAVLRGQLVRVDASLVGGEFAGTAIQVKVRDSVGADGFASGAQLLIPAEFAVNDEEQAPVSLSSSTNGVLVGDFVAFVRSGPGLLWTVVPEGLWIGCDDDGTSLEAIWDAALFDEGSRRTLLSKPLVSGDGTAVFDVRLVGGDRFRVSVPERFVDGFDYVTESSADASIVLSGSGGTLTIEFNVCADQDGMIENRLGSVVRVEDSTARFCRPDELLSSTLESIDMVSDVSDGLDVRPIAVGTTYMPFLTSLWPGLASCGNCAGWGPMVFPEAGVVLNRTGNTRVTAVSSDDLSEIWTRDTGGAGVYLHGGPDGVYVEVTSGDFQRLDPATGEVVWSIERDDAERYALLAGLGEGLWILQTSFSVEGDDRAPLLRSVDTDTGQTRWLAEGRAGTEWQWTIPVSIDGFIVVMDVSENAMVEVSPVGGSLRAYDLATGALAWTTDLGSPTEAFDFGLVSVFQFETGPALIVQTIDGDLVRVDPLTGVIQWRAGIGRAVVDGTVTADDGRLAISINDAGLMTARDPETGEPIPAG